MLTPSPVFSKTSLLLTTTLAIEFVKPVTKMPVAFSDTMLPSITKSCVVKFCGF
jgi:hypothetical protein